ncbi:MAG TPA: hypothetical protein H9787_06350 [Candidatus Oscillibacter excrementigallinarum]|uniref:Lipoprotein n=1 Tax=Candidatus Oscillibacter excrementigallinarum TaxID=2838716 RepID=A0A9D2LJL0_9FIRM|nr:hypothetical protein [Candidatus Oscillibacter excrementigallinarum]
MRRMLLSVFLAAALLTGCGGRESSVPPDEASETALTEQDVLNLYTAASAVYDWFDLTTLPLDMEDARTEGDLTYYRVDAENLSLPVSAVPEPTDSSLPWQPQPVTITSLADLRETAETYFSPEIADSLFALSPDHYKDFDGVLYATDGGRGSNVYLLDKAAAAEQVDEDHWTVTVTFYADSYEWERPSATVGYSQTVLDLERTEDGWKFTSFVPSDGLDLEAETVFTFTYTDDGFPESLGSLEDCSDLKLACWLLHADGAYSEGPSDTLTRRFLEDPDTWFEALSVFPDSPWEHADTVMAAPVNDTYAWYGQTEQDRLEEILNTYQPENDAQQALLDALKEAQPQAIERSTENATASFCLVTEGQFLSLGHKEGGYPWDYEGLPETPQSAGTGDNGEAGFAFSFGGVDAEYVETDDGDDLVYRMTTTVPGPQTLGGIQVGDAEDDVKAVYTGAVQMEAVGEDQFGADYALIHEPGGLSYCKHISFFITDGEVSAIQVEDLMDGRLLG